MEGDFAVLMGDETEPSDDYLQIRLTDKEPVIDAMPKLRVKFPNTLGVEQDMGYREDEGSRDIHLEQMSDEDILKRFVHQFRDRTCRRKRKPFLWLSGKECTGRRMHNETAETDHAGLRPLCGRDYY